MLESETYGPISRLNYSQHKAKSSKHSVERNATMETANTNRERFKHGKRVKSRRIKSWSAANRNTSPAIAKRANSDSASHEIRQPPQARCETRLHIFHRVKLVGKWVSRSCIKPYYYCCYFFFIKPSRMDTAPKQLRAVNATTAGDQV